MSNKEYITLVDDLKELNGMLKGFITKMNRDIALIDVKLHAAKKQRTQQKPVIDFKLRASYLENVVETNLN